ncbi:MAG TPA: phosphoribosylamine--glycine ligase [Gemmatimonadaceae bacterium]|nr:phosphoribosylamine--glycine ligase [Gemmatimonadaceae bacterium]
MKVLLVGGGGREHALAWKLHSDDPALELIAAPGNPGIAEHARCEPVSATNVPELVALAERERADLTVVGPEAPLAAGIADAFRERGLRVFGPTAAAARIESSKSFAKQMMREAGVPTALAVVTSDVRAAKRAVAEFGAPVVIKASGLAAGKGVIVAQTVAEAESAVDRLLGERSLGDAGSEILVEEFMEGEELSLFVLTDGTSAIPMMPAQDHKRLLDGDAGPNTGGMGAYAPVSLGTPALVQEVTSRIIHPSLSWMRGNGSAFNGLLYAGLMLTRDGPKVVEFNCRFGDPETQAVLPLLKSPLLDPLHAIAGGGSIEGMALEWSRACAVTTVVAAAGYPDAPRAGDALDIPATPPNVRVFHAGTARANGRLVSSGGRVLAVTAVADDIREAARASRDAADAVVLDGKQLRRDIGWREIAKLA